MSATRVSAQAPPVWRWGLHAIPGDIGTLFMLGVAIAVIVTGPLLGGVLLLVVVGVPLLSLFALTGYAREVTLEDGGLSAISVTGRAISFAVEDVLAFEALGFGSVSQLRVLATGGRSVLLTSRLDLFDELLIRLLEACPDRPVRTPAPASRLVRFWGALRLYAVRQRVGEGLHREIRRERGDPAVYESAAPPRLPWLALAPNPTGVLLVAVAGYSLAVDGVTIPAAVVLAVGVLALVARYAPCRRLATALQVSGHGITGRDVRGNTFRVSHADVQRVVGVRRRRRDPQMMLIVGRGGQRLLVHRTAELAGVFDQLAGRYTLAPPAWSDIVPRFDVPI